MWNILSEKLLGDRLEDVFDDVVEENLPRVVYHVIASFALEWDAKNKVKAQTLPKHEFEFSCFFVLT